MRMTFAMAWLLLGSMSTAEEPTVIRGLKNPESVAVAPDGRIYMTVMNEPDKVGDGSLVMVDKAGKITTIAAGMDEPKGLVAAPYAFYVADLTKVWKIDASGKLEVFAPASAFPRPPVFLNDLDMAPDGALYVTDSGDKKGKLGAIFRIDPRGKVSQVFDAETSDPKVVMPNGVKVEDPEHLLLADMGAGILYRLDLATGKLQNLAEGLGGPDGIAKDAKGRIFIGDWKGGKLFLFEPKSPTPRLLSDKFTTAADIFLTPDGLTILVPDMKGGTLTWFPVP